MLDAGRCPPVTDGTVERGHTLGSLAEVGHTPSLHVSMVQEVEARVQRGAVAEVRVQREAEVGAEVSAGAEVHDEVRGMKKSIEVIQMEIGALVSNQPARNLERNNYNVLLPRFRLLSLCIVE